jgi:peroxiredoxin
MKKILLFLSAATLVVSCNKLAENEFEIEGTIDGTFDGKNAILQKPGGMSGIPIDTVKIEAGKFVFEGKAESPSIHYVTIEGVPNVGIDFILESGNIELTIDKDSIQKSKRSGTFNNEKYQEFRSETTKREADRANFQKKNTSAYLAAQTANDKATMDKLTQQLTDLEKKRAEYPVEFIQKNPKAYISVLLLKNQVGMGRKPYADLKKMYDALDPEVKKTKDGKELSEDLEKLKKAGEGPAAPQANTAPTVEVGQAAPDFSAPGTDGKAVSLKQSMGKVTLIDFWASWCGPCRKENPNVVAMYNELHGKGLNIIGVSLDKPGEGDKWKKAIADDKLTWTHVSNLMEWDDPIVLQYGVLGTGIPSTFLLDASGKVVAKNLRGDELKAKVKELLSK